LISRKPNGLSSPNFYLNVPDGGWVSCHRRLEMQFQRFMRVGKGLLFGFALTGEHQVCISVGSLNCCFRVVDLSHSPRQFAVRVLLQIQHCAEHQRYLPLLPGKIESGEIDPSLVITHTVPLEKAPEMYKTFRDKEDGCIKVVLKPHA
jgi:hypothetical protein